MKRIAVPLFAAWFLLHSQALCAQTTKDKPGPVTVIIETSVGTIEASIDTQRAPATSANFLKYVDSGAYNGGRFHRIVTPSNQPNNDVKIEVVQAGRAPGSTDFPPIALERTGVTGVLHRDGTISMARGTPDSATSDFFICIGDQPSLDFGGRRNPDGQGFAAFGQVIRGMDIVRRIQGSPADGQTLTPPVQILKLTRKKQASFSGAVEVPNR